MSLPVTVYRWDDAGAPQLTTGKPSEIIAILKKCLVEGYGSKSALGWTIPFEDVTNFKVAFRNSTVDGSGGFVQFWAPNGTDTQASGLRFKAAKSMSALDTFIHAQLQMQCANAASAKYWVLIGTSTAFWLFSATDLTTPFTSLTDKLDFFIGDIDTTAANDPSRFVNIMCATTSDLTYASWNQSFNYSVATSSYVCRIFDTDGSANALNYRMDLRYFQGSPNMTGEPASDCVYFKPVLYAATPLADNDRLGVNAGRSVVQPYYRGTIPGLLNTPQGGYYDQAWPVIKTINGQQHMLMPGYNFGRAWINMETWYD